jgi:hypothetical protein
MAKQRYINTRFWDDGYIATLDPLEKLLFIYFLTNPLTEICGAYEIPLRRVAFDTGIDADMVLKIVARFADADKIIYRDGWVLVCNFLKHQSSNPKIDKGVEIAVKRCPDWIKDRLSIAYDSLSHLNPNSNSNTNPNASATPAVAGGDGLAEAEHQSLVVTGVKREFGLKKLSAADQRAWQQASVLAFENDFTPDEFLECLALLRNQKWRTSAVKPQHVVDNLTILPRLRAEAAEQAKANGPPERLPTLEDKQAELAASRKTLIPPPSATKELRK